MMEKISFTILGNIDDHGIVQVLLTPHNLTNQDIVEINEVKGLESINGGPYQIKVISPLSFQIIDSDIESNSNYQSGGIVKQIKQPEAINFRSLEDQSNLLNL